MMQPVGRLEPHRTLRSLVTAGRSGPSGWLHELREYTRQSRYPFLRPGYVIGGASLIFDGPRLSNSRDSTCAG